MQNNLDVNVHSLPVEEIREFCRQRPIQRLSLFGSALRGELTSDSDIDLLVEYIDGVGISYFDLVRHEMDLTALVGRSVDLRTPQELSRYFRQDVIETARLIYEKDT